MNILLSGIVGSVAYGLDTADSDVDRLGIYASDTVEFYGLDLPVDKKATKKIAGQDYVLHEARKYCLLALSCNPTVSELMGLPEKLYEKVTPLGTALIDIRDCFLSAQKVRDAYLGYASSQFTRLENRGDGSFSSDTRKRTAKHARHLLRLLHQGYNLYANGKLQIIVEDPRSFRIFGERVAEGDIELAKDRLVYYEYLFDQANSPLPEYPNKIVVQDWLLKVRKEFLN